ncbi:hypothetical protein COOONC_15297 [Cooperia oncophora]
MEIDNAGETYHYLCKFQSVCQQTLLIPTSVTQCDHSKSNCSNHTTLIAQLNPMQPELCIQLQQGGHQLLFMRISLDVARKHYTSQENTIIKVQYQNTHVPHMRPSHGAALAAIHHQDVSFIYRIYHVPVDDNIYEVFQCPSWFETISFHNKSLTSHLKLLRSHLHQSHYSTNDSSQTITQQPQIPQDTEFSYACSSDPRHNQSPCSPNRYNFKRHMQLHPAEYSVNCYCTNNNVSRITQLQNTFPLPIPEGLVSTQGRNNIPTITTRAVSVQAMITFDHTIRETRKKSKISIVAYCPIDYFAMLYDDVKVR